MGHLKRDMAFDIREIDVSKLPQISRGHEYDVYALNDELVLKISNGGHLQNSGQILSDLQGLPFIPKVYWWGDSGEYLVMQRIKGIEIGFYMTGFSWFRVPYDYDTHKNMTLEFFNGCIERGWIPRDLHFANIMIDKDGHCWIVDVGGFVKIDEATIPPNKVKKMIPSYEVKKMLDYGKCIVNAYEKIENMSNLLGLDKVIEICSYHRRDLHDLV